MGAMEGNYGITPLHLAAINPNIGYLKQMVEQSNIIDHSDDLRRTPLFFAAACSSPEPLKYLIQKGAKIDIKGLVSKNNSDDEVSPLLIAVKYGKAHNVPYLLGVDCNDDGKQNEEEVMAKYADVVNQKLDKRSNKTLLHVAAYYGHSEVVSILLEYGANPKALMKGTRISALHLAAQFGHLEVCRILIEHSKAPKNKRALLLKDNSKKIPLIYAIMNGHLNVVKYMLSIGCPVYCKDSSDNAAIHYAAAYGWNDILKCLMEAPFCNPGVFNMWKLSPFFIAMIKGNDLCATTLLETKNIDYVNAVDSDGKSILHHMLKKHKGFNSQKTLKQLTRLVLELGADAQCKIPNSLLTPLHILADNAPSDEDSKMALVLMQKGARPDAQDKDGNTPISLAITHQNFKLIETMIVEFNKEIAGTAKKSIDWRATNKEEQQQQDALNNALNLNTSVRDSWQTPLMMVINLDPPSKTPQKVKEPKKRKKREQIQQKRRKEQMIIEHGANIGHFVGSSFDQNIVLDVADAMNDSSDSDNDDEEERERQQREKVKIRKEEKSEKREASKARKSKGYNKKTENKEETKKENNKKKDCHSQ